MKLERSVVAALALLAAVTASAAEGMPSGAGHETADLDGLPIDVFTYRPASCRPRGILVVFHGIGSNAATYRDDARPLADGLCRLVVAPLFDEARFPSWRYQRGGVVYGGHPVAPEEWTVNLVPRLVAWARAREGRPDMPYALLGHSAGAQVLGRAAAYVPLAAERIVIADPSTWVLPDTTTPAPFGFGGIFPPKKADAALRRYLAAPITVLVGAEDTGSKDLAAGTEAEEQGANRLERARTTFDRAREAAHAHGWAFGWRFIEIPGIAHSAQRNFASPQARDALKP